MEYFNYLGSMITFFARYTRENQFWVAMAKIAFNKKKTFHQQFGFKLKEETRRNATFEA
jgi:hypothetical protein